MAEWGDVPQFSTADLAAMYNSVLVFSGATLGLWAATAVAVTVGAKGLRFIPLAFVSRIAGAALLALGVYSMIEAIQG
jgi:putative Ca2+/H+ antiporter (TMEM165/GDT1 family)